MSQQEKFEVGDIVKLKSGGPDMTIQGKDAFGEDSFHCQWFSGKKLERGSFPTNSLERVSKA